MKGYNLCLSQSDRMWQELNKVKKPYYYVETEFVNGFIGVQLADFDHVNIWKSKIKRPIGYLCLFQLLRLSRSLSW